MSCARRRRLLSRPLSIDGDKVVRDDEEHGRDSKTIRKASEGRVGDHCLHERGRTFFSSDQARVRKGGL